jgi:hypothetical protein
MGSQSWVSARVQISKRLVVGAARRFDIPAKPFAVCKTHPDSEKNPRK